MRTVLNISLGAIASVLLSDISHATPKPYTLAFNTNPPFSSTANGQPQGIAINIISQLFQRAKLPYQFSETPLVRAMTNAKTTEKYCAFPVQRAQQIEADYQWISPILITHSGLFARQDFSRVLLTLNDAKKIKVGVLRGSGDAEYLKALGFSVEETNSQEQNLAKLRAKRFDLWAADNLSANFFIAQHGSKNAIAKELLTFRITLGSLACHINMPQADVAKLQATLDSMITEGVLQKK
jgi:polar amino acid transport system substrate-binding protein